MTTQHKKFFFSLLAVNALLILLHVFFGARFDLFNLDRERTPGAYWSGLQLLAIAALSVGMVLLSSERVRRLLWGFFAFLFMSFGFDEISELHENITYYVSTYLHIPIHSFLPIGIKKNDAQEPREHKKPCCRIPYPRKLLH